MVPVNPEANTTGCLKANNLYKQPKVASIFHVFMNSDSGCYIASHTAVYQYPVAAYKCSCIRGEAVGVYPLCSLWQR